MSFIFSRTEWPYAGSGLLIAFIQLLQLVTTSNYSSLANSGTRFLSMAHIKSYQFVFTSGCLVTDPNNVLFCSRRYRLATVSHLTHCSKCSHILDWIKVTKIRHDRRSVGRCFLVSGSHLGAKTGFLLLSDRCRFVDVRHPLWREDGSVLYNCWWSSPAQSFSGPTPTGLMTIFYCLRFETPPTWRTRSPYLYPPGTGRPSYSPRH
jgi:hypothetical protein